jgi:hypothetical protein
MVLVDEVLVCACHASEGETREAQNAKRQGRKYDFIMVLFYGVRIRARLKSRCPEEPALRTPGTAAAGTVEAQGGKASPGLHLPRQAEKAPP